MRESIFKFKQFQVKNHLSAMKVGTDGVLVGAWSPLKETDNLILDIGAGCGLISLMMAQRSETAFIVGVEINQEAAQEAQDNIKNSIWAERIVIVNKSIEDFAKDTDYRFDKIVSNPPFYIENILSPNEKRSMARSTTSLSFNLLFEVASKLLTPAGEFSLITPASSKDNILNIASDNHLYPENITTVHPTTESDAKRILWNFSKDDTCSCQFYDLTIEKERHIYTNQYIALTKDFYLKM